MSYKAKLLLLEAVVFAVAAILYAFLFYDTYCEFWLELVETAKPLVEVTLHAIPLAKKEEGGETSA